MRRKHDREAAAIAIKLMASSKNKPCRRTSSGALADRTGSALQAQCMLAAFADQLALATGDDTAIGVAFIDGALDVA